MSSTPLLQTERLLLRPHTIADFADISRLWADPAVVRHISGRPSTQEETWSRLLRYAGHWQLLGFGYWVVQHCTSGEFLGEVGFADFHRAIEPGLDGKPEAGWVFATAAQGQGFAREAVSRILDWADSELVADTTCCIIAPEHAPSIRLAHLMGYAEAHLTHYHGEPTTIYTRDRPG